MLLLLVSAIIFASLPAFAHQHMRLEGEISTDYVSAQTPQEGNYLGLVRAALREQFPDVTARRDKRALYKILSLGAAGRLQKRVNAEPGGGGTRVNGDVPLCDHLARRRHGRDDPRHTEDDKLDSHHCFV